MKNLLKETKEKIEKFVFKKESVEKLYHKECDEATKDMVKICLFSGLFFVPSFIGLEIFKKTSEPNIIMAGLGVIAFISSFSFISSLVVCIFELFKKGSAYTIKKEDVEIEKLRETGLSLQELEEIKPLLNKIKDSLSEEVFFDFMKMVETRSNEKYGNAYYFIYLIDNYDEIIENVNREQKGNEVLKTQLSSFLNTNKNSES